MISKIYITIYSLIISFSAKLWRKIGCALSKPFWPPLKAKIKSYFTTFSLDFFIRWMTKNCTVFLFHIYLT